MLEESRRNAPSPDLIIGKNVETRIEIEDATPDHPIRVVVVFDRKADMHIFPWECCFNLACTIEQVISDICKEFTPTSFFITEREQAQVKLNYHRGLVAILTEWTDRLYFTSLDALFLFARALRKQSQDSNFECRGTHIEYNAAGLIKKIHNYKAGFTQIVPGR